MKRKLEKFSKNKKEKRIVIISIIGMVLLIGGITLYKTFALYEEKKEFNVLKGVVPDYREKDRRGTLMMVYTPGLEGIIWPFKDYIDTITKIVFEDTIDSKTTELSWDVSETQDKSVMSYLVPNESDTTQYTLYIQSEGGVKGNIDSGMLFYNFVNLISIENLNLLDTSNVINMSRMFDGCTNLKDLDVSNFNTSKVNNMLGMFNNCSSLINLNLSNCDMSKVTDMRMTFHGCSSLINLDLGHFDTNNVMKDYIFRALPNTTIIKVKDGITQSWILNLTEEHRPISWTTDNIIINT